VGWRIFEELAGEVPGDDVLLALIEERFEKPESAHGGIYWGALAWAAGEIRRNEPDVFAALTFAWENGDEAARRLATVGVEADGVAVMQRLADLAVRSLA
jgi:hypothetical protein